MSRTTETEEVISGEVVPYDTSLFPELRWQDPERMGERLAKRFAQAGNLEDLFAVLSGNNTQGMVGRRVEIQAVDWLAYESDRGVIPNAVCDAVDIESGELLEFATTSGACTMFIRRAELLGLLPVKVKIVEKVTKTGNRALNFEPA